jgi:hypothetical protein
MNIQIKKDFIENMTFLKRFFSILIFTFCCLTLLSVFIYLIDNRFLIENRLVVTTVFIVIDTFLFLFARWLWRNSKVSIQTHLDSIKITGSVIGHTKSGLILGAPINWIRRVSIILCAFSGFVALYIYFIPYKSALSDIGKSAPWIDALCFAEVAFLKEAWGCKVIGKPFISGIRKSMIERHIESLQGAIIIMVFVFVICLALAFLLSKGQRKEGTV